MMDEVERLREELKDARQREELARCGRSTLRRENLHLEEANAAWRAREARELERQIEGNARLAEENSALEAALRRAKDEATECAGKLLEEEEELEANLRRAEEEKLAARRDSERMLALMETMEEKLKHFGEEIEAAELSSKLCTQSTTLATRV